MADVQKEDGYTPIAHTILEALAKHVISPDEWRVLMMIFRKTYGWNKKIDSISLSEFSKFTGIKRNHISRITRQLWPPFRGHLAPI
jgi:phage replication O-like protein O